MHCCGAFDVDGSTINGEAKLHQALHGIYLPHSPTQHHLLLDQLPTHLYKYPELSSQSANFNDDLIEIPHSTDPSDGYNFTHLLHAFPTMFPYSKGGMGDPNRGRQMSWR
jgi:hypothetical protein